MLKYTLLPLLTLTLLLFSGQSMQMVEPANACCCAYCCSTWHYLVFGPITILENGKARIGTKKGSEVVVDVAPDIWNELQAENEKHDFGFITIKVKPEAEAEARKLPKELQLTDIQVTDFVPVDRVVHGNQDYAPSSAQSAVNKANQQFEEYVLNTKKGN